MAPPDRMDTSPALRVRTRDGPSARYLASPRFPSKSGAAPTLCWKKYIQDPLRHMLTCGHEVVTVKAEECASNCLPSHATIGIQSGRTIVCKVCLHLTTKKHANVFAPRNRKPTTLSTFSNGVRKPMSKRASRAGTVATDHDTITKKLNEEIEKDSSYQYLVKHARGPGLRTKSTINPGRLAYHEEIETNKHASQLPEVLDKLNFHGIASSHKALRRHYNLGGNPSFLLPDQEFGEEVQKPGQKSHQHSGFECVAEDGERFCICLNFEDGSVIPCADCHHLYHPPCIGKEAPIYEPGIGGTPPFLCIKCEQERAEAKRLADLAAGTIQPPRKTVPELRAETLRARDERKRLFAANKKLLGEIQEEREEARMVGLFGEDHAKQCPHLTEAGDEMEID